MVIMDDKKMKLVPALRFGEFCEEWEKKKLGEISIKVGSGSTPSGGEKVYTSVGVPFIRSQNVINNQLVLDNVSFIPDEINTKMKGSIVKPQDILLNITGGSIGRSCIVPHSFRTGNVNQHVCIIRLKKDYIPKLLQLILSSEKGQKLIFQNQTGSGREGLNFASIRSFKLNLPTLPEQQKIANFLSSVDKKIEQLRQKVSLLEDYKKGVMQQIFSQQIRFKDDNGEAFADWEVKKAKDVFKSHSNKKHSGNLRILAITQDRGTVYRDDVGIDIKTSEASVKSYKIIEVGDFIISLRSFQGGIEYSTLHGICSPAYTILKPTIEICNEFFRYYFKKESFIKQLASTVVGIRDGKQISYSAFSGLKLLFPSLKEQQKIANCLSSIDKKIEKTKTQLKQAQTFKKGLLQQLFV